MIGRWMFGPGLSEEEVLRILLDARVEEVNIGQAIFLESLKRGY
jgi:pyridoxine 5'-phosphate synthase PdxJ